MSRDTIQSLIIVAVVAGLGGFFAWAGSRNGREIGGENSESNFPTFAIIVIIAFGVQWLAFIPADIFKTEKFYDLFGGGTYFVLTAILFGITPDLSARKIVIGSCIMAWAFRLAAFLFLRVCQNGKDDRFDEFKKSHLAFFNLWHIQGLWITITASAGWIAMTSASDPKDLDDKNVIDGWLIAGMVLWALGFGIEVIADQHKMIFKKNSQNCDQFIHTGLWAVCRHPNYLGEIMLWLGILFMAIPAMRNWQYVGIASPVFVTLLLNCVSGVPMLERKADAKWGGRPDYEEYKRTTPVLIPLIGWKSGLGNTDTTNVKPQPPQTVGEADVNTPLQISSL